MPAVTTEGLILKRHNFGEADRILTVLTDRYGKISMTARGVRRITSRRAGNIELLNRVKLHLFKGKSYTLTEAESIETFQKIKENLTLSTMAFHIIELIDRLIPEEQKNPYVYDLTVAALNSLQDNPRQLFIRAFEIKLLTALGFWSTDQVYGINEDTKTLLQQIESTPWNRLDGIDLKQDQAQLLEQILRQFIEKTLESSLKSMGVMEKLKQ